MPHLPTRCALQGSFVSKKIVYIASPYTKGDVAVNTRFQCEVFDRLLSDGRVLPVAPLWSHFQHLLFPRPYADWTQYDQDMLHLYDCCLRLSAVNDSMGYREERSTGADAEVATFQRMGKPIFYSIEDLYEWLDASTGRG
jgi:hypothetical protein